MLFLGSFSLWGQVEFRAQVSKKRLGINERLRVDFVMNQNGDDFSPPSFNGFQVVGGPNQSISNSWVNGKRTFSKTYTYFLTPERKGKLKIGQAQITIDDEVFKSVPIDVTVTAAVKNPGETDQDLVNIEDNLHLVAEISKASPYLNEAVTVVYKLYFRSPLSISNPREVDTPTFSNFWSHIIRIPQLRVEQGTYKGESYNVVVWRKAVLYPQKTGAMDIEPLTVRLNVDIPTRRRDFFGNRVYRPVQHTLTSGTRKLRVKPLPESGKPESFNGAVGKFELDLILSKESLKASESFQAQLKLSGQGNLKLVQLPQLVLPGTMEVYEPEHSEQVKTYLSGMRGSIQDQYTVVPQYQGQYPIPPVEFSYFDPKEEVYKSIRTAALSVDVYDGPVAQTPTNPLTGASVKKEVPQTNTFRFIGLNTALQPINGVYFWNSGLFYGLLVLPFLIYFIIWMVIRKQQAFQSDRVAVLQRESNRLAKKYLSSAQKSLNDKGHFYEALERAMFQYLRSKLRIEMDGFSKERIASILAERKVAAEDIKALQSLLMRCDQARFTPLEASAMENDYQEATQIIAKLDRAL